MIRLSIVNKRNKDDVIVINFNNAEEIKYFIKNITTRDLLIKRYIFNRSQPLEYLFFNTYRKEFYTIKEDGIHLNIMKNGLHRELKSLTRREFNNRTLARTLEKIQNELLYKFDVIPQRFKFTENRYEVFKFATVKEHQNIIEVKFDKLLWTYEITSATVNNINFLNGLIDSFDKNTRHLRAYRKKTHNENNT